MVALGVGKNMVRSIRLWSLVSGIASVEPKGRGISLTKLGNSLLGERGPDPFLEDIVRFAYPLEPFYQHGESLLAWQPRQKSAASPP